jgi:protease-4
MKMTKDETPKKRYVTMFIILIALTIFSMMIAFFFTNNDAVTDYNTAIIPIKGVIVGDSSQSLFSDDTSGSGEIISSIERVINDDKVRAVIFEINSPGGSPVATDEIAQAIKTLHENNKTSVAWIRETGASGAYWIATSTNHIIANRMSIVGSIGVYGSYLELYGLMNKYNVTYKRLVSGEYKDSGTPFRPMSPYEESMMQAKLDKLHEFFIEAVAENRNMSIDDVRKLSNGEIYLGIEGKDNGLVDELGSRVEVINYLEKDLNTTIKTKEFSTKKTFLESLMSTINKNSYYMGRGISSGIVQDSGLKITT